MTFNTRSLALPILLLATLLTLAAQAADPPAKGETGEKKAANGGTPKAALAVTVTNLQSSEWPQKLVATGNVAAWQEVVVGAELSGMRLSEVIANVGDRVKRGQVLARLQALTQQADLAQTRAALAEAEATLAEAQANAERARQLQPSGAMSAQQINQYVTAEQTAKARVESARARLRTDELRLSQTRVTAPDDGVISARLATVGAVVQPGQELFRLIRQNRLEWRAEVPSPDLTRIKPGMPARIFAGDGQEVRGKVRVISPVVDVQTRNGLVYVDLERSNSVRAGSFARGEFEIGRSTAVTLPQSAVLLRDGFSYVMRVGADSRVVQTKVGLGRRVGDRVEITSGLQAGERVVAAGGSFLADGDLVKVVAAPTVPPAARKAPPTSATTAR